uniref:Uncharacterized protein n=1 Tax=Timema poppense TaxID=170557 RepID=A0A7R9CVY1_TIMPO|nr:unnamed protein product [Timema poppensis]
MNQSKIPEHPRENRQQPEYKYKGIPERTNLNQSKISGHSRENQHEPEWIPFLVHTLVQNVLASSCTKKHFTGTGAANARYRVEISPVSKSTTSFTQGSVPFTAQCVPDRLGGKQDIATSNSDP